MKRRLIFDGQIEPRLWAWRVLSFLGSLDLLHRDRGHGHRGNPVRVYGRVMPAQPAPANDHRRVLQTCAVPAQAGPAYGGTK